MQKNGIANDLRDELAQSDEKIQNMKAKADSSAVRLLDDFLTNIAVNSIIGSSEKPESTFADDKTKRQC